MVDQLLFKGTRPWLDQVVFDEAVLRRGMDDLGLAATLKEEVLIDYHKGKESFRWATKLPRGIHFYSPDGAASYISRNVRMVTESIKNGIRRILSGLDFRVVGTEFRVIKIPIFYLTAPGVKGSKVSYSETQALEREGGWEVTVLGTGMGSTHAFRFQGTSTFSAANSEKKLVFAPVVVEVSLITTHRGGEKVGEGCRLELSEEKTREAFTLGVSQLSGKFSYRPPSDAQARWHPLAEDKSDAVAIFEDSWSITSSCSLEIGVDAFATKLKAKASVRRQKAISLKLELPVGRNYGMLPLEKAHGLWWEVNEGPLCIAPNTAARAEG